MNSADIILSLHARMQMRRRRISFEDVTLILRIGEHVDGKEEGTREACTEIEGRPVTVVYDAGTFETEELYRVVTVILRRCGE